MTCFGYSVADFIGGGSQTVRQKPPTFNWKYNNPSQVR